MVIYERGNGETEYQGADLDAPNRNEIENQKDVIAVGTGDLEERRVEGSREYMIDDHGVVVADLFVGVRRRLDGRERRRTHIGFTILRNVDEQRGAPHIDDSHNHIKEHSGRNAHLANENPTK